MYWVLEQNLEVKGPAAVMDLPEEINIFEWMSGQLVKPPPKDLELMLRVGTGDFRGDIIGGVVTLFSEEFMELLHKFGIDNIQAFDVSLKDPLTGEVEYGYYLVNIVGLVACVQGDWGDQDPLERPVSLKHFSVDAHKAQGLPLFRLKEQPSIILVNNLLHDFLRRNKVVGVRMRRTQDYTGW